MQPGSRALPHIPELDGLRGIAILLVLWDHYSLWWEESLNHGFPALGSAAVKLALMGQWGVQLFFVLSGFLITSILLATREHPGYFRKFYARRFLRIFPAYYGALAVLFLLLPRFVTYDAAGEHLRGQQGWLWCYLSNLPALGPLWDSSESFKVRHFWSLAVEEHFYLFWPLIVYLCPTRRLLQICLGLIGGAMLLRLAQALTAGQLYWVFRWSSLTSLDGLAAGAVIAVLRRSGVRLTPYLRRWRWLVAVAALVFLALVVTPRRLAPHWVGFGEVLTATIMFTYVIILAVEAEAGSRLQRWCRWRWLQAFGRYSYAIYVIHNLVLPLLVFGVAQRYLAPHIHGLLSGLLIYGGFVLGAILINFGLGFLSWHAYEKHFLKLKRHFEY